MNGHVMKKMRDRFHIIIIKNIMVPSTLISLVEKSLMQNMDSYVQDYDIVISATKEGKIK